MTDNYTTTPEHFALFKHEAQWFIDLFGLWDWRVEFRHELQEGDLAACEHNTGCGKVATLTLSTDWGDHNPTPEQMRKTAFHEVCHLLLADALGAACFMDLSPQQRFMHLDRAHHAIIRRLENVVLSRL